MSWAIQKSARPDSYDGASRLIVDGEANARGTYAKPLANSAPVLNLDLIWAPSAAAYQANPRRWPRITGWGFEVRPDLPFSLIGQGHWDEIVRLYNDGVFPQHLSAPRRLPDYTTLLQRAATLVLVRGAVVKVHMFQLVGKVRGRGEDFAWPTTPAPLFRIGLGIGLNPNLCCVGLDFLRAGLLCWDDDRLTHFFPRQPGQAEVALKFHLGHFPLPSDLTTRIKR